MPIVRNPGKVAVSLSASRPDAPRRIDRITIRAGTEQEVEDRFVQTSGAANLLEGGQLLVVTEALREAEKGAAEAQSKASAAAREAASEARKAAGAAASSAKQGGTEQTSGGDSKSKGGGKGDGK